MSVETIWALTGVFLAGATPWLEAIVVIPAGIIAGLPAIPTVVAGAGGNILTVALAAYAGEWFGRWWARLRRRRAQDPHARAHAEDRAARRRHRVQQVMDKGGLPLLALLSPALGTQIVAVAAVALGSRATPAFAWISLSTVLWCIGAAWAAVAGVDALGGLF